MSLSLYDSGTGSVASSTASVSASVDVVLGDLIVVLVAVDNSANATVDTVTDSEDNTYELCTAVTYSSGTHLRHAYVLSAGSTATGVTVTASFVNSGWAQRQIMVLVFTPDSGDTVSLADSASTTGYGTSISVGTVSTTETDAVVVAGRSSTSAKAQSEEEIDGVEATVATAPNNYIGQWYLLSSVSSANATATVATNTSWAAEVLAFESAAAGGTTAVPVFVHHYRIAGGL